MLDARRRALFNLPDFHVLGIEHGPTAMTLTIETTQGPVGCPGCGVLTTAHGRRDHRLHDLPAFGARVRLVWRKRLWHCHESACAGQTPGSGARALGSRLRQLARRTGRGVHRGIRTTTLDPFHGYASAIRDELPEAIKVLDAFHMVKLGGQLVDEVRNRVQQDALGHRGWVGDPLYGIRCTLQIGVEHLTPRQVTCLNAKLEGGDPHHGVTLSWHGYQKLRAVYHARPEQGWQLVPDVVTAFPTCPIPEVARLGRTLRR